MTALSARVSSEACCQFAANKKPLWKSQISLEIPAAEKGCTWEPGLSAQVDFVDSKRLAIALHMDCEIDQREPGESQDVHTMDGIVIVDTKSGKAVNSISWRDLSVNRLRGEVLQLFVTNEGNILFRAGNYLKVCSADLKEIQSRYMPDTGSGPSRVLLAPDRKNAILTHSEGAYDSEIEWLDPNTLKNLASESIPNNGVVVAVNGDHFFYYPAQLDKTSESLRLGVLVNVRARGEQSGHPLCDSCYGAILQTFQNGLVFLSASAARNTFWLVDQSGKTVYRGAFGSDYPWDVVSASQADTLAFSSGHLGNSLFHHDAQDRIVVFDMNSLRDVYQLKLTERPEREPGMEFWHGPRIALSPRADRLAVVVGTKLALFDVP